MIFTPLTSVCCINIYERVKKKAIIYDIPVYLTHTSLVEDAEEASFGQDPYRFIILKLSPIFTLTLLCGPSVDINSLYHYISKSVKKEAEKELSSPTMAEWAIYYDVPDQILTWMFRSSHAMFSQSKAECTVRTGVEGVMGSNKDKQNEWFRDLMGLYSNYTEDVLEKPKSQDQYILSSKYWLYVVRKNNQELSILYNAEASTDVEQISEVAHDFFAWLSSLMKPDYIFSAQPHL